MFFHRGWCFPLDSPAVLLISVVHFPVISVFCGLFYLAVSSYFGLACLFILRWLAWHYFSSPLGLVLRCLLCLFLVFSFVLFPCLVLFLYLLSVLRILMFSLSLSVHHYLSLSILNRHYLSLSILNHHYLSLLINLSFGRLAAPLLFYPIKHNFPRRICYSGILVLSLLPFGDQVRNNCFLHPFQFRINFPLPPYFPPADCYSSGSLYPLPNFLGLCCLCFLLGQSSVIFVVFRAFLPLW